MKKIDESWDKLANEIYITDVDAKAFVSGADSFRTKALDALAIFTSLSNDAVFQHEGKAYVSLPDVIVLIEGLFAKTIETKNDDKTST